MRDAGVIRRRHGLYLIRETPSVDTRGDPEGVTRLLEHWSRVGIERIPERGADDWFAYNVFALSPADHDRVREIVRRTFREIRSIVAAAPPADRILLLNLQLVRLDGN